MAVKQGLLLEGTNAGLRVYEDRILKRIFGSKGGKNGEWRTLHSEDLRSLYRYLIVRVSKSRTLR